MGSFPAASPDRLVDELPREARSETGYEVLDIRFAFSVHRSPGLTNQRAHVYVATLSSEHVGQSLHPDEDVEVVTLSNATTPDGVLSDYPADNVDASLWYYFLPSILSDSR